MSDIDVPHGRSESFLPLPAPPAALGTVSAVRSTLVTTSLDSLRARGLDRAYVVRLPAAHREALLTAVAGTWLPFEAARAHYEACDGLGLDTNEKIAVAMEVGDRVHGTFLGLLMRAARTSGVTPWTALAQAARLYGRLFCGGGVAVTRRGPKDARVDLVGNALCDIEYFRVGVRGVHMAALRLFCRRIVAQEPPGFRSPHAMSVQLAWA
jgi:hypothetical protein